MSMSNKQVINVVECTTKYGTNWYMVDSVARVQVVKNNKVVESQAFRNLAEKLLSAGIAVKVDWKTKAGVKTDKYFINGRINQANARKSFEVVII